MNPPRSPFRAFLWFHLPALVYAGTIIGLSSLSTIHLPRTQFIELDKVIHFTEYALFTLLVFRSATRWRFAIMPIEAGLFTMALVTVFAFGDEFYQSLVPGRQPDIWDFATDTAAAGVALVVIWLVPALRERLKR